MIDIANKIEQPPIPEQSVEQLDSRTVERVAERVSEKQAETQVEPAVTPASLPSITSVVSQPEPVVKQIEDILSDGLSDFYLQLPQDQQQRFKQGGEEAAKKINTLLQQTKIKIKEIIGVIVGWLKGIPGLNKFFIEQSAKIKADKILIATGKDKEG